MIGYNSSDCGTSIVLKRRQRTLPWSIYSDAIIPYNDKNKIHDVKNGRESKTLRRFSEEANVNVASPIAYQEALWIGGPYSKRRNEN